MRVIAIAAQKGGAGKTTTAAAIAQGAIKRGHKALLIDLDGQGSLTRIVGADSTQAGSYDLLRGAQAVELVQRIEGQPDIISGNRYLFGADAELAGRGSNTRLKAGLAGLNGYDLVILDTPPALGAVLLNALTAAQEVIIPLQIDPFATETINLLSDTIGKVKERFNPELTISGVLLTRYSLRTVLARDLREAIAEKCKALGIPIFQTTIRDGVAVKEAQTIRASLYDYAPKSKPAKDYEALLNEMEVL